MLQFELIFKSFDINCGNDNIIIKDTVNEVTMICTYAHLNDLFVNLIINKPEIDYVTLSYLINITQNNDIKYNLMMLEMSLAFSCNKLVFVFVPVPSFNNAAITNIFWIHSMFKLEYPFIHSFKENIICCKACWKQYNNEILYVRLSLPVRSLPGS
jgi:hypothetical protein